MERDMIAWLRVERFELNDREFCWILEEEDEKFTSGYSRFALQPFQIHAERPGAERMRLVSSQCLESNQVN